MFSSFPQSIMSLKYQTTQYWDGNNYSNGIDLLQGNWIASTAIKKTLPQTIQHILTLKKMAFLNNNISWHVK